jgi:hypothetical protein
MKYFVYLIFLSILVSCAEEKNENKNEEESSSVFNSVKFQNSSFTINSNIKYIKYIVSASSNSNSSNSLIDRSLSNDSADGYTYGLNSSDQIITLFNPYDSGFVHDIVSSDNRVLIVGEFTKDGVNCLLLYLSGDSSNCLALKQDSIGSIRANFINGNVIILIDNKSTSEKEAYIYSQEDGFSTALLSGKTISSNSSFIMNGDISDTVASGDYAHFFVDGESSSNIISFEKHGDGFNSKVEPVSSESVQEISGSPLFISEGKLRQGWGKSINYNESSNNRTISDSGLLVSYKDARFQMYFQEDYKYQGYSIPSIFYLKPKRSDLPDSYPDYTLERIRCCQAKNNPGGTRDNVEEMSWNKVLGYKKYVLAYGELVGEGYPEYQSDNIQIQKAIILIDADSFEQESLGVSMSRVSLYDYNNTSSNEDNIISVLSFDSVSNIENYKNGFKVTGASGANSSDQRTIFFNPGSNAIETPSSGDQKTFIIKERL